MAVYIVLLLIALLTTGITDYGAGRLLASVVLMPGLATALVLRSRKSYWPWWKVLLCLLAWAALFGFLQAVGNAGDVSQEAATTPAR